MPIFPSQSPVKWNIGRNVSIPKLLLRYDIQKRLWCMVAVSGFFWGHHVIWILTLSLLHLGELLSTSLFLPCSIYLYSQ